MVGMAILNLAVYVNLASAMPLVVKLKNVTNRPVSVTVNQVSQDGIVPDVLTECLYYLKKDALVNYFQLIISINFSPDFVQKRNYL